MIIDFHTHIFPDKIAPATIAALSKNGNIAPHSDGTAAGLISSMTAAGVDIAVNLPVVTRPSQFDSILSFARSVCERDYSGKKIISFAGIHPDDSDVEAHLSAVAEAGIKGIKLHPDYQSTFIDDERYVRIFKAAKQLGLIVVTHAGLDGAYVGQPIKCTPERVLRLLDRVGGFPRLVLAHLGGNELFDCVFDNLAGEDVYFDTAFSLHGVSREAFTRLLAKHGVDKILFATDSPWRDINEEVNIIRGYNLGAAAEGKIFSDNAKKLLGIG